MKSIFSPISKQVELPLKLVTHQKQFTFIDLFAGIGGFRIALDKLGGQCLGYSEIDKQAIKVYQQNFISYFNKHEIELGDITKISQLPHSVDIIVGGVPCQPWSVAGCLRGFEDKRGKLWFDVIRLVNKNQPKGFIFENVSGLASPKNRDNLELILNELANTGYCVKWKVLNAYDFGLPQNRDRVFIVGIRRDIERCQEYKFPKPLNIHPKVLDILDELKNINFVEKVKLDANTLFKGVIPPSRTRFQKDDELNDFFIFSDLRNGHTTIHSWDIINTSDREKMICLTLLKYRRSKKYGDKDGNPLSFEDFREIITDIEINELNKLLEKGIFRLTSDHKYEFVNSKNMTGINNIYRIILPTAEIFPTLTATGSKDYIATVSIHASHPQEYKNLFLEKIYQPQKYIPITAKHACKLQGFPLNFEYHKKDEVAKKQFGNAVPVPVVEYVAKELLKILDI
ncbi:DNA cytosine methyltransferase [Dolichospermum sp. UHCC 0684]|jgi:DNA (cytosine-5)-methyltransferase 1|uniref:DNA cytosine methyltransferase n=1 Tax=unclassified Dolichospermum TaxID=2622029 RepID=UPI0014462AE7|nr:MULTISPECIES: DNA cytosine methyltransferase [unclassified Dolichospermum]MEA5528910.1 DNA cytosine methyltransferase [Dolichospermum sp. UHCC 0684]MTJ34061.1 DNA cytosine methyltransferase [Dolichospermum sp. UHCC 0260]QSV55814.1 MAG: DNA cytosine methyltransferase [Dolichospermum sp. UKL201]